MAEPSFFDFSVSTFSVFTPLASNVQHLVSIPVPPVTRISFFNFQTDGLYVTAIKSSNIQQLIHYSTVGQRMNYIWRSNYGTGIISGVVTVEGSPPVNVVLVEEANGYPIAVAAVEADGSYLFTGLFPGKYAVVAIDLSGSKRGKVVHTLVPPPTP